MVNRLPNRTAIVTGASSGLGRAIALAYAKEGASVICADLDPEDQAQDSGRSGVAHTATHQLIIEQGGKAIFIKTDVREEEQVEAMIAAAVKEFGRLDIIVNNAGIAHDDISGLAMQPGGIRIHQTPTAVFDRTMLTNARGVFLGCKYATAQFLRQESLPTNTRGDSTRGWIINMSSLAGLAGAAGAPSYVASKHAVVGLTKQVAVDYARDRVHCNAICPGFVDTAILAPLLRHPDNPIAVGTVQAVTAQHPWGTLGQAQDVVGAAMFLASDEAAWVTGIALSVDGGYMAQ